MRALLALVFLLLAFPAAAIDNLEQLADPAQEARARTLFKEVRCVVCQNQSIDDSEAGIARDLRIIIREQIEEGRSNGEILSFLTARYGDYVLLEPPFRLSTLLLWVSPLLLLLAGGSLAWVAVKRRPQLAAPAPLSAEEQARLNALMGRERE